MRGGCPGRLSRSPRKASSTAKGPAVPSERREELSLIESIRMGMGSPVESATPLARARDELKPGGKRHSPDMETSTIEGVSVAGEEASLAMSIRVLIHGLFYERAELIRVGMNKRAHAGVHSPPHVLLVGSTSWVRMARLGVVADLEGGVKDDGREVEFEARTRDGRSVATPDLVKVSHAEGTTDQVGGPSSGGPSGTRAEEREDAAVVGDEDKLQDLAEVPLKAR